MVIVSADHSKQRMSGLMFTPEVKVQGSLLRFNLNSSEEKQATPT